MSNQYHPLLQTPSGNLSRMLRHVNIVYTSTLQPIKDYRWTAVPGALQEHSCRAIKTTIQKRKFLQPGINISRTTTFRSVTAYILEVAFLIAGGTDIRWRLSTGNSAAISTFPVYIFGLLAGICCILFAHDNTSSLKLNFVTDYYKHYL